MKVVNKKLTLYTDLSPSTEVNTQQEQQEDELAGQNSNVKHHKKMSDIHAETCKEANSEACPWATTWWEILTAAHI